MSTLNKVNREIYIACLFKDEEVREHFLGKLDPIIFTNSIARNLFESLNSMLVFNELALRVDLNSSLSDGEIEKLMVFLKDIVTPLGSDGLVQACKHVGFFIKSAKLAYLIGSINKLGIKEDTFKKLSDICEESDLVSSRNVVDFTQDGALEMARSDMFPTGSGSVIKSSFSLINNSLVSGGYTAGIVVGACGRPGLGKSTFLINEGLAALNQGVKVLHIFLGDMKMYDAVTKYTAAQKKVLINDVIDNTSTHIDQEMNSLLSNLRVACYGSYELNVNELSSLCKNIRKDFEYDMLIIDYDANIRPSSDAGLYSDGGTTYGKLEALSRTLKVALLIGSQAKLHCWQEEILGIEAMNESSRKQHVLDLLVTIGRSHKSAPVGTMNIAKNRRGLDSTQMKVLFAGAQSRIVEIDQSEYDKIVKEVEGGTYAR